jgi:hypothetical protein
MNNKAVQFITDVSGIIALCISLYVLGVVEGLQRSVDDSLRQVDKHISSVEGRILTEIARHGRSMRLTTATASPEVDVPKDPAR